MEYRKNELYHHGILGQKWGKRNGPPYPLGASDHSEAEKKAGWRKSLGKSESVDTRALKTYNDEVKIRNGKAVAKKVLIGVGAVAAGVAIASVVSSSGANYGAELFDHEVYKKAVELSKHYSYREKEFYPDGRVVFPPKEYGRLIHTISSNLSKEMRKADSFAFHLDDRVYICENVKNDIIRIVNWFDQYDWEEALWEETHGK